MNRSFTRELNGRKVSYRCWQGRHEGSCDRLDCTCICHDEEQVEDRSVTSETVLRFDLGHKKK